MEKYSVCVLGCGFRGRHHSINFLNNRPRFDLVAVCDMNEGLLNDVCDEMESDYHVKPARYTDAEAMLKDHRPDVFCFATHPGIRLSLIELGLKYDPKAIVYEKPMANTLAEAARIHELCVRAGVKTTNAHIHKYGAHWKKIKQLIDERKLGKIHSIHATSRGWYLAYVTHLVDYIMWLAGGSPITEVAGHAHGRRQLESMHPSPEYVLGKLVLKNGIHAILECGSMSPSYADPGEDLFFWFDAGITVTGENGWVQAIVGKGWRAALRNEPDITGDSDILFDQINDGNEYIADLARWLDGEAGFVHPCNGEQTWLGFQASMGILQSALEHRPISLPLELPEEPVMDQVKKNLPDISGPV